VGRLAGRLVERRPFAPPGTARAAQVAAMGLLVVWVAGGALVTNLGPDVLAAAAAVRARGGPAVPPLAGWARRDTSLLSEDPFVPVALGQTPVVLDPFMLLRLEQRDPEAVADLAKRIDAREFDLVVLIVRLDDDEDWWRNYHFGETVIEAIRRSYVPAGEADGYYLYKPSPTRPG
jgi:hypothetical protein